MAYVDRVNDVWKVTAAATYPTAQVQEWAVAYEITVAGTGDSRPGILALIDGVIRANVLSTLATDVIYNGVKATYLATLAPYAGSLLSGAAPGTGTGLSLPTQTRVVCAWKTELVGRRYRGRFYGWTPTTAFQGANYHPSVPLQNAWGALMLSLKGPLTASGATWRPVIWHRRKLPTDPFINPTPVLEAKVREKWGTQRSGGDYGRPNILSW